MNKNNIKKTQNTTKPKTENMPILPLRGTVMIPGNVFHFDLTRNNSIDAANFAMKHNMYIFAVAQRDASLEIPTYNDIYDVGIICRVVQLLKENDSGFRIVLEGLSRARIDQEFKHVNSTQPVQGLVSVNVIKEAKFKVTEKSIALIRLIKEKFLEFAKLDPGYSKQFIEKVETFPDDESLTYFTISFITHMFSSVETKQSILEVEDDYERAELLIRLIEKEIYVKSVEYDIFEKVKQDFEASQRESILREHKRIIEMELGENDDLSEIDEYRNKIEALGFKDEIKEILLKECSKLEKLSYSNAESATILNYLDTVLSIPWNTSTDTEIDLKTVKEQLDNDHYGLEKVKDRILESLAVRKLNPDSKGNILCLVGPPGTGKTSIALSIAKSIGRNSARISLGGVTDEAEIRGHRRTYIASMPGRIINAIIRAKSNNPLLILDEIDKLSSNYKGDPTSALLEVLDPEQNSEFVDHYIDLPFDLSNTMFITTANDEDAIPDPLRDRMDVIELSSYTRIEKFNIAKKHLIPKQLKENGLLKKNFKITDKAIYILIDNYVKEAGVRNLERVLASLMRKAAIKIIEDPATVVKINDLNLEEFLGPKKYLDDDSARTDEIGIANGLAWTSVGGTLLPIECAKFPGTGKIELTGSLGDVMQESAKTALSCIRSRAEKYGIDPMFYKDYDIHIHAPDGATPKDGPSAGITMALTIYSVLTSNPVRHNFAMTGEISLTGKVMPIGGLKEKAMAAYKAKIKNVIIPAKNMRDLYDIDDEIKKKIKFIPVNDIDEVIAIASVQAKKKKTSKPKITDTVNPLIISSTSKKIKNDINISQ